MKTPNATSHATWNPRYFNIFANYSGLVSSWPTDKGEDCTYSKKKVNHLHDNKDDVSYLRLVITITRQHQNAGNKVMGEHLPVVFSPLLDIDNQNLLHPEGELH